MEGEKRAIAISNVITPSGRAVRARKSVAAWDLSTADITGAGVWIEKSLSAIVPAGTKAIDLKVEINGLAGSYIRFAGTEGQNVYNSKAARVVTPGTVNEYQFTVPISNKKLWIYASNVAGDYTVFNGLVCGWWK